MPGLFGITYFDETIPVEKAEKKISHPAWPCKRGEKARKYLSPYEILLTGYQLLHIVFLGGNRI